MFNNNLNLREEVSFGFKISDKQEQFQERWTNTIDSFLEQDKNIIINNAPNRIGKTITTLKYFLDKGLKVLYVSDRHNQINEVDAKLNSESFRHWFGLDQLCSQKYKYNRELLIKNNVSSRYLCKDCIVKKNCGYINQFQLRDIKMVGAPKEFLQSSYVDNFAPDIIVFDEIIDKGKKIEPILPELDKEIFEEFDLEYYYYPYNYIKSFVDKKDFNLDKEILEVLKDDAKLISFEFEEIIYKIKYRNVTKDYHKIADLLKFIFNMNTTVKYIEMCINNGYNNLFEIPFIYDAFKLIEKHNCKLILLNTSLEPEIFQMLTNGYDKEIHDPITFEYPIINDKSVLLHYNNNGRSFSKSTLFETHKNGKNKVKVKIDDSMNPIINKDTYAPEIFDMVFSTLEHSKKLEFKTGIITFKIATPIFHDKADVIGHFGGHQGSDQFDDVDVLIILGTFNLNPGALYQKYQCITQNYQINKKDDWINSRRVNGMRLRYSDNEKLNQIKTYKLNEEHGQAIFRSGSHVQDKKIVIAFGLVPEGVEKTLTYSTIKSKKGLKIALTKLFKKFQTQ